MPHSAVLLLRYAGNSWIRRRQTGVSKCWTGADLGELEEVQRHLDIRAAGALRIGALLFSNVFGTLGVTPEAEQMLKDWRHAGVLPAAAPPHFVVFGGTAEGRELSRRLADEGAEVTVCVATGYGSEVQEHLPGIKVKTGPLSADEKQELLRDAVLCVDATHPYAHHITESVREACEKAGVRRVRLVRAVSKTESAVVVKNAAEAAEYLRGRAGNILLTTGVKELQEFQMIDRKRLFPRILPSPEGLSVCREMGIPSENVIAMQGPFSRELNEAMIRQLQIAFLVSKDGGQRGGFPEKAAAAENTGTCLIVIGRTEEEGLNLDETMAFCREYLHRM